MVPHSMIKKQADKAKIEKRKINEILRSKQLVHDTMYYTVQSRLELL